MPEDGHHKHSVFSKGAEITGGHREGSGNRPWGKEQEQDPPRDVDHWGKRVIPSSCPLKYGMWYSLYWTFLLANLYQLSWICSSLHYTPASLQNMRNWGTTLTSLLTSINISEFLHSFIPSPKHRRVTRRKQSFCPRVLSCSSWTVFKNKGTMLTSSKKIY